MRPNCEHTTAEPLDHRVTRLVSDYKEDRGAFWFYSLHGRPNDTGLEGYYGPDNVKLGIVIAKDVVGKESKYKMFAFFPTIGDILDYVSRIPHDEQNFYETIGASTQEQRPYFDIDIKPEYIPEGMTINTYMQRFFRCLIESVEQCLTLYRFGDDSDEKEEIPALFNIYSTQYPVNPETGVPEKWSFHVLLNRVYFSDSTQMKKFGLEVIEEMRSRCGKFSSMPECIDVIWSKIRQLRLIWSSKIGGACTKQLVSVTGVSKKLVDNMGHVQVFSESFVTNVEGCRQIVHL